MKTFLLRGVPHSVQDDGWWLSSAEPSTPRPPNGTTASPQSATAWPLRAGALFALVLLADVLLWQVMPGLSLAVFGLAVLAAGWALAGYRGTTGLALAALLFLPVVERVQALSLAFWLVGLVLGAGWIALARWPGVSGALRFVGHAPETVFEGLKLLARTGPTDIKTQLRAGIVGWLLPLGLGLIFLSLLTNANPVLGRWMEWVFSLGELGFDPARMIFWLGMACLIWPFLCLSGLHHRLELGVFTPHRRTRQLPRIFNQGSIARSLILFNLVFAVQTLADLAILFGGASLPQGMSYAEYAHRGAYPLLATALLAGLFALIARPFTTQNIALRFALLGWLVQTLFLVISSLFRLESYISAYGLTHLRLAALIWMGLVAAGVVLVIWQVLRHHSAAWMLKRCALLGAATLYACSFFSFAAAVAQFNLSHEGLPLDHYYICSLDRAALPAITAYERQADTPVCDAIGFKAKLHTPQDWREWGFRDWRTARSLSALKIAGAASDGRYSDY